MICGIALPLNAREITLGISERYIENQNTINNILLILKCYIYLYIDVDIREKSHTYTEVFKTSNVILKSRKTTLFTYPQNRKSKLI
jgi:hypothetical protein